MHISQNWRLHPQRYAMTGERCPNCGTSIFPPREVCPVCKAEANTVYQFGGKGEVLSFTTIMDAPAGFEEQAPYTLALIQLDEGPKITAQLTDLGEAPAIGMRVEMVTRKLRSDSPSGVIVYGYKFRPMLV
jgi:hypothetical protein